MSPEACAAAAWTAVGYAANGLSTGSGRKAVVLMSGDLRSPTGTSRSSTPTSGSSATGSHESSRSTSAAGYTPYALREGLYERGWKNYLDVLQRFWQPYLDGRATFGDAIARMVSSL